MKVMDFEPGRDSIRIFDLALNDKPLDGSLITIKSNSDDTSLYYQGERVITIAGHVKLDY